MRASEVRFKFQNMWGDHPVPMDRVTCAATFYITNMDIKAQHRLAREAEKKMVGRMHFLPELVEAGRTIRYPSWELDYAC